ncbi:rhomboid family intramembrane serine protease [Azorhizobium caulinodans]|uniref:rhomboid family intramembrane serine protease n=1 Tax=Azorhizobium caulinodans TaxID=7 RepID=UPI002FBE7B1B
MFWVALLPARAYVRRVLDITRSPGAMPRQPVFNVPGVVTALAAAMAVIQLVRTYVLSEGADLEILALFSFVPGRYDAEAALALPGGIGADIWTFVTYALLHANWIHLGVNLIWMLAFATPVARRFGPARFLAFFAVTAAVGAFAHLITHRDAMVPMIGASAAIAGLMAAAVRFAFAPGGSLSGRRGPLPDHMPAQGLGEAFRDPRVLGFMGVWIAANLLFGVGVTMPGAEDGEVAWQAHLGGFFAGLLLFSFFDPVGRRLPREKTAA